MSQAEEQTEDYRVQMSSSLRISPVESDDELLVVANDTLESALEDNEHIDGNIGATRCEECGEKLLNYYRVGNEGIVEMVFEATVFNAQDADHAVEAMEVELGEIFDFLETMTTEIHAVKQIE